MLSYPREDLFGGGRKRAMYIFCGPAVFKGAVRFAEERICGRGRVNIPPILISMKSIKHLWNVFWPERKRILVPRDNL